MRSVRYARATLALATALVGCREHAPTHAAAQAGHPRRKATDPGALLAAADSQYARGSYDSARVAFTRAGEAAAAACDTLTQAKALTQLGLAEWHLGRYAAARDAGERALSLKRSARLTRELAKSYNALGLLAYNEGRVAEALDRYQHARRAALDVGDSIAAAKADGNAGLVYSDIGDFDRARRGIAELRRVAHAAGDSMQEANALGNLGLVAIRSGNPLGALPLLTTAVAMHRIVGDAVGAENALGQLGTAYAAMGEPQLALAYLDSALTIASAHGMRQQEADDLQLSAELYDDAGDHARALEFLERARLIADAAGMRKIQGDILRSESRAMESLGDAHDASVRISAAARLHRDAGASLEWLDDELLLAELDRRMGSSAGSDSALAAAGDIAHRLHSGVGTVSLAVGEARVAELAGQPRRVLALLAPASELAAASATGRGWEIPALQARAYAALGRTDDAVRAGREAVRAVERVRRGFASGALRASFTSERAAVYTDLVVALLRGGHTSEALAVADAARSRALLEHMAAAGHDSASPRSGADLVAAEQLLRRINQLIERLRVADTTSTLRHGSVVDDESSFLSRQLADARRDYETLMRRANVADRRSAAVTGALLPAGAVVRSVLAPDEALLEYLVTPRGVIVFVVTPSAVRALTVPVGEAALASRIRVARDLLSRRDVEPRVSAPVLRDLGSILIAPVEGAGLLRGVRRLVVVPQSSLAYLPFAALIEPSGRYLVERFEVLLAPSAASFAAVRREPIVALARGRVGYPASIFAPFPAELPGTRDEAVAVERENAGARIFIGGAATEPALRAALAEPRTVHIATHGVLNPRSPMFSRLEVAGSARPAGSSDDGRLEVHELLDLTVRSPLVFLSGCETGAGAAWSTSFLRGDDYATLAEAFLFAGARNVVSTLWRIEDRGAADFAARFYADAPGRGPAASLAEAQRQFIAGHEHASPYYWAAYVIAGDGRLAGSRGQVATSIR